MCKCIGMCIPNLCTLHIYVNAYAYINLSIYLLFLLIYECFHPIENYLYTQLPFSFRILLTDGKRYSGLVRACA